MTVDRAPAANPRRLTCTVDAAHEGATVEDVLRQQLGLTHRAVSRAKFINPGITLDGQRVRVRTRVHAGQTVAAIVSDAAARATTSRVVPERGPLAITYEDEDLLVLDKPPRLAVHPSPGHQTGTLGNYAVAHLIDQGLPPVLHAVHRLDLETSGLVVLAKNAPAQHRLTEQLHTQGFSRVLEAAEQALDENAGLREEVKELREQLLEEKDLRTKAEIQLKEMSQLSAGVAKKASQDELLKAIRVFVNKSKRKKIEKRIAVKEMVLEMVNANGIVLPEDLALAIDALDDEQTEARVVNVQGNYNDIHDNGNVNGI